MKQIRVKIDIYHGGNNRFFYDAYDLLEIARAAESELFKIPCAKWFGWRDLGENKDFIAYLVAIMEITKAAYKEGYEEIVICGLKFAGYWKWITGEWSTKNKYTQAYAEYMRKASKHIRIRFEGSVKL